MQLQSASLIIINEINKGRPKLETQKSSTFALAITS